ncbi:MAG TPA: hypothetical protein PLP39_08895 [Flavobacterium lutivivi]|nr:hypothetical protein [Flavobacterium lutivivi]
MNDIEKIPLSKEMKILLLQVLKAGEINLSQAVALTDYFAENKLLQRITIVFNDFQKENET